MLNACMDELCDIGGKTLNIQRRRNKARIGDTDFLNINKHEFILLSI